MLSLGWDLGLGGIRTGKKAAMLHAELPGLNVPTDFALGLYAFVAPTDVDATRKNKNCKHDTMPDHRSSETTFTFLATEIADGQIPAGRFGQPSEIANAVVFLASDEAAFTLGAELLIDGGMSL
jgi:NAD(P)-dependent dehydrogenase (short-subunit alcohol dehydrogenase family)